MTEMNASYGPLQELWGAQEVAPVTADPAGLRSAAAALDAGMRVRNRRENLVAAALAGFFLLVGVVELAEERFVAAGGALLTCAAMLWIRLAIRRWGRSELTPADLELEGSAFAQRYERELARQRRCVLHAWLWYVLPIFAGLSLLGWGQALARGESVGEWASSFVFLLTATVAAVVVVANLWAARALSRRIAELRATEEV